MPGSTKVPPMDPPAPIQAIAESPSPVAEPPPPAPMIAAPRPPMPALAETSPTEPEPAEPLPLPPPPVAPPPFPPMPAQPARTAAPRPAVRPVPAASPADGGAAAAADAPAAAAPPARPSADWNAAISAWLHKHKTYPAAARSRGDEGSPVIRFTVARDGRVLSVDLALGSGSPTLDDAARRLLTGATVPRFPPDMPQDQVTVQVRINYSLDRRP
jgi:TonB family protein